MKRFYYLALVILSLVGLVAVGVRLVEGMKVTALTSAVPWGMWVGLYIYFIGLSAGSFLLSTLIYVFGVHRYERLGRMALLSALFALFAGMLFIWIDLGHPWRFYEIFTRSGWTSVLKIEAWLYLLYIGLILGELWFLMRCDLDRLAFRTAGWRGRLYRFCSLGWRCPETPEGLAACHQQSMRWVKVLGIIGVPTAVGVHGGTGAIFAVVKAKPLWFTGLFPIIFLVSALVSGAGLMTFLYALSGRRDQQYPDILDGLAKLIALFVSLDVVLLGSDLVVKLYGGIPDDVHIWNEIMFGPFWYVFWGGQVILAYLVPLFLVSYKGTRRSPFWLGAAGLAIVVGIVAVRLNLIIPAYLHPPLEGLDVAYMGPRLIYHYYFPSAWEWASSIGLIAFVTLLFSLSLEVLPMAEGQEV
ncbi:MAG: NrfD/PsrC family molybdoenzyme membrane anchor subunit [Candidatus Methylomirabilales bacterium]